MRSLKSTGIILHVCFFVGLRVAFSDHGGIPESSALEAGEEGSQSNVSDARVSIQDKFVKSARELRPHGGATNARLKDKGTDSVRGSGDIWRSQVVRHGRHRVDTDRRKRDYVEGAPTPVVSRWENWAEWSPCSTECGRGIRHRSRECFPELGQCRGLPLTEELCENDCASTAARFGGILGTTRGLLFVIVSVLTMLIGVRILVIIRRSRTSPADDQAEWRAAAVRADERVELTSSSSSSSSSRR